MTRLDAGRGSGRALTVATADAGEDPRAQLSPWERFGWLMGAAWIVFLGFPIVAALHLDHVLAQVAALAAVLAFGGVYIAGLISLYREREDRQVARRALVILAIMAACAAVTFALLGFHATGMITYLLALSLLSQPLRRALLMTLGWIALTVVIVLSSGLAGEIWYFIAINLAVAFFVGVVRLIDSRQDDHERLQRELDVVAERERVARDVHDVLGHSLTVVTVRAELAERLVDTDPQAAKAELAQLRALTREALGEVRATVAGLRVARLSDELESARRALAGAGIEADVPETPDAVDPRHRLVLAWVLREAVTNVVRHSRASRCVVRLAADRMEVVDDGVGLGPGDPESSGLRGVRERVESAGGALMIGAAADGDGPRPGTRLEVRW